MKTEKMDINAVCFGILCNFTPVCGEERAKEAVALIRSLQAQLEQAKAERDAAIKDLRHSDNCDICIGSKNEPEGCDCECLNCQLDCGAETA